MIMLYNLSGKVVVYNTALKMQRGIKNFIRTDRLISPMLLVVAYFHAQMKDIPRSINTNPSIHSFTQRLVV